MRINYREPYWVKFKWDLSESQGNQYVTTFNKIEEPLFNNFLNDDNYVITVKFAFKPEFKTDKICMVLGKPGKNMGLSYNLESGVIAWEFWTVGVEEGKFDFHFVPFNYITPEDIESGVILSIVRENNKFSLYRDFEKVNIVKFKNNLIDDYRDSALFIGCSSTGTLIPEHRYYGEMELEYFSILHGTSEIDEAQNLYETPTTNILNKRYYENIICLYDFKTINNLGIVYDESSYNHFLEKVPQEFLAP
jgi:hypothetical protein